MVGLVFLSFFLASFVVDLTLLRVLNLSFLVFGLGTRDMRGYGYGGMDGGGLVNR